MNTLSRINRKIKRVLKIQTLKEQKQEDLSINSVVSKTGWDRKTVVKGMLAARKAVGISFDDYDINNFYRHDKKQWVEEYDKIIKRQQALKKEKAVDIKALIKKIEQDTGWTEDEVRASYKEAHERTCCRWQEYYKYEFYHKTPEQQESLFLMCHSLKLAEKYGASKQTKRILCNKKLSNEVFSEYLHRQWCLNTTTDFDTFRSKFKDVQRIIYKPLGGNKGFGIKAFDINADNIEAVYRELYDMPDGVVEEFVRQHPEMNKLTAASVNTVRVVTVSSKDSPINAEGDYFEIAYAALKIGGGNSIVDNFSRGGMTAAIDLETGTVISEGIDVDRHMNAKHPVTGTDILGFKIPYFEQLLAMVREASDKSKMFGYFGWDIAISEAGPSLIEVNLIPGASLLSAPYSAHNKDSLHVMEKYL